jgi:hypothetical protein
VFLGGSMVAGAVLAHLEGEAFWQKVRPISPPPISGPAAPGASSPLSPAAKPAGSPPVMRPTEIIPDSPPSSSLSLKPPTKSGVRDLITEQGSSPKAK